VAFWRAWLYAAAFHDACFKNIADAGFADRIAWMRAAAAEHKLLDLTRVGIFGGSAGGQSAGAVLAATPESPSRIHPCHQTTRRGRVIGVRGLRMATHPFERLA
jgi:hypothetical protein